MSVRRRREEPGKKRSGRGRKVATIPDRLDAEFGPEPRPEEEPPDTGRAPAEEGPTMKAAGAARTPGAGAGRNDPPSGPIPGLACAGDACLLRPVANLVGKFGLKLGRGHGASLSRAAFSGLELMKALRDFLDEEIAFAERTGEAAPRRYEKLRVE